MAAVAQFAVTEGLVAAVEPMTRVRILSANTSQTVYAEVPVHGQRVRYDGDLEMAGVPGTGAGIRLRFMSPGGRSTGALLPTAHLLGQVDLLDRRVAVTVIAAVAPSVFVDAETIHSARPPSPAALESDRRLMNDLESVRRWAAVACGLAHSTESAGVESPYVPLVGLLYRDGSEREAGDLRATVRMLSGGNVHRALPLGAGLAAGAALCLRWLHETGLPSRAVDKLVTLSHPSGHLAVQVAASRNTNEDWQIDTLSATITGRRIFAGLLS